MIDEFKDIEDVTNKAGNGCLIVVILLIVLIISTFM